MKKGEDIVPRLRITSKSNGFRRCGVVHPDSPVIHAEDSFTPEQVDILKAEPMLIVEELPEKAEAGSDGKDNDKGGEEAKAGSDGKKGKSGK